MHVGDALHNVWCMTSIKKKMLTTSLVVQRLRLHVSNVGGVSLIPGQGTMIPHVTQHSQNIKINK